MPEKDLVRHIALFRWKTDTTAIEPDRVVAELTAIAARTKALNFEAGPALGLGQPSYDFAVLADFASAEDYLAYREDPRHRRYLNEVLRPAAAEISAIQVSTVRATAEGH
jgi:hypothetical protein